MMPARLALVLDDIKLGLAITQLAELYFQAGERSLGLETLSEAERCYASAAHSAMRLTPEYALRAEPSIQSLRKAIQDISFVRRPEPVPSATGALGIPILFNPV
jgi:hypothetical protein